MSSKRSNAFQGRPEQPYDDRDEPADPPKRASAAQLAARKIKSAKGSRRPAGATSGISVQPMNFGFGGGDTNPASSTGSFGFGSQQGQPAQNGSAFGGTFGGSTTNSFPPTQSSTASNNFSSSSFPTFGGNGTNTAFNPTPPSASFNFTASASNPFAASAPAPAMNGSANGAANGNGNGTGAGSGFGSSIFNSAPSQPQSNNLFSGFAQQSGTSSAAPSGSIFGTSGATSGATSSAPATNMFGTTTSTTSAPTGNLFGTSTSTSSAPSGNLFGASSATAPAPATNMFGSGSTTNMFGNSTASSAQSSAPAATTTAAPSNPFAKLAPAPSATPGTSLFNFGASQPAPASTQESTPKPASNLFGASTSAAPLSAGSSTPGGAPFSLFGAKTQESAGAKTQESSSTPPVGNSLFKTSTATTKDESASAPASTSLFGSKPAGDAPSTPASTGLFQFGAQSGTPTTNTTVFKGLSSTSQSESASAPAPSNSLFQFGTTASDSASKPAATPSLFGSTTPAAKPENPYKGILTGGLANKQEETTSTAAPVQSTPVKTNMFSFGTPQTAPAKTTKETEDTPKIGLGKTTFSSTTQNGTGLFAQPAEKASEPSPFNFSSSTQPANTKSTPSLFSQSQPASSKADDAQKSPFSFTPQKPVPEPAQSASPNLFGGSSSSTKQQALPSPASRMPTLTGAAAPPPEAAKTGQVPNIPRFNVPGNWGNGKATGTDLHDLTVQLVNLNIQYLAKITSLPTTADWSQLSKWHARSTDDIMQKIAATKKQKAAAKGITGNESSLSVKRKADAENVNDRSYDSPSKKSRGFEAPSTPAPKSTSLFSTTPKATPPPSETSNLFGSVLNKSTTDTTERETEPAKSTPQSGFSFSTSKPAGSQSLFANTSTTPAAKPATSQSLFGTTSSTPSSKPEGSKSLFQMPTSSTTPSAKPAGSQSLFGGSLLSQFSSKAKSYEELVEERKKKDKDDDYDSDDETYEEWSARWDKKEAERVAKLKEAEKENPAVKLSAPSSTSSASPGLLSGGFKFGGSTSGASTPALLGSRVSSPAPSNGGQSVFDTSDAPSPASNNIFGHLSAGPSSNQDEDEDDEEEGEEDSGVQSTTEKSQPKRRVFQSESESEESLEETTKNKKQEAKKPSLADRITKDISSKGTDESEKENGDPAKSSIFGQANGVQTPTNKPFTFFDFDSAAGSKTVPPKDKSAVDQTFKAGTPIKFGTAVKSNPTFQFMPATPGPADFSATPSKPPAPSTFSFLASASTPGSVLSSRAPTPLSETETSAADNEDEDGEAQNQLDLSGLTEEEKAENEILFHVDPALCKHQSSGPDGHKWENYARGPLWILKNKETGKAFVRMRLSSGATMLNYNILPKLKSTLSGKSDVKKMVSAIGTKKDGKTGNLCFAVKTPEVAAEFSRVYNENLPS